MIYTLVVEFPVGTQIITRMTASEFIRATADALDLLDAGCMNYIIKFENATKIRVKVLKN